MPRKKAIKTEEKAQVSLPTASETPAIAPAAPAVKPAAKPATSATSAPSVKTKT